MALKRLTIDGYGQVELNNVAFRRDGRIEAQCAPNSTDFSDKFVENGMLLAVDIANRTVKCPTDESLPIALVYSTEHIYDERTPGLKNFYLKGSDDFYPRLGYPAVGDKWFTNTLSYDDSVWADDATVLSALASYKDVAVYGKPCSNGAVCVTSSAPATGMKLKVVNYGTMPDGTTGVQFHAVRV